MNLPPDGIRKAAILAGSLDQAAADAMLEALEPEQARQVRQCMVDLDQIDPKEQRRIIDEFRRVGPLVPKKCPPGIELDDRLARRLNLPAAAAEPAPPSADHPPGARPFHFLRDTETEKLTRILADERPQTIALVLSHLPAEQAGSALARIQPALQVEVLHRLIDLEETDPAILREVEEALESRLAQQIPIQRRRVAGMKAVTGIMEAAGGRISTQILENLAAYDRPLAEQLSPPPLDFDDLLRLDDATLGTIFREADPELALTALIGAAPPLVDRILRRFPATEAETVRRQLDHPGPIRLSDLEEAQRQMADLARRLAMEGRIRLPQTSMISLAT
jgi:flagellar motor switch protein FliG